MGTFAVTHLNSSAVAPGSEALWAEEGNCLKYVTLVRQFTFETLAVETGGVYEESTAEFVAELGRRISEVSGDHRETYWLEQRIELDVQRGNTLSILTAGRGKFEFD